MFMKKKKIIIAVFSFLVLAMLFMAVNRYMLNKDNKGSNLDNNNNSKENNSTSSEIPTIKDNKDNTLNQSDKSNENHEETNNSGSKNNQTSSSNNASKENSKNQGNKSDTINETNLDDVLAKNYPVIPKVSGTEETKGQTKNGFAITEIAGITYIDGIMMVNKTYGLPSDYLPVDTVESCKGKTSTCNKCINKRAYSSFTTMQADAKALGLNIYIASGYRPFVSQESIYNRYIKRDGKAAADTYSARPGYSEHQTSYTFDLNSINDSFANTNEGKWVNENAYLYGFIIRFPKGKDIFTGYKYEPWHLRYVGYKLAKKLYNNGNWLSLEEYFGVDSKYQN